MDLEIGLGLWHNGGVFSIHPETETETAMSKLKKSEEMTRPSAPKTMEEMREMMGEIWALLFEERRVRLESDRRHAKALEESDRRHAEALKEADERRAESDRRHAEAMKESDRRHAEALEESDRRHAEADKRQAEADKRHAEYVRRSEVSMTRLERTVEGIGKRTGDFMENTGHILEQEVVGKVRRKGGLGPVKGKVMGPLKGEGEYDGVVVNGEAALVLEVKRNLLLKDVREFLERRLPRFAEDFPNLAAGRKVYGALAFELEGDKGQAAELARENGLLLVQVGARKRMTVLNPDPAGLRPIAG